MMEIAHPPSADDDPLQVAVCEYYTDRGHKFKCRSPLDFACDHDRMLIAKQLPLGHEESAVVDRLGTGILRLSLERVIDATPALASLSLASRKALIDVFCSEETILLEAKTHYFHPHSTTPSNSVISLCTLLLAISRQIPGEDIIDSWVKMNLAPAMRHVSHVLQACETALSSFELVTDLPVAAALVEPSVLPTPAGPQQASPMASTSTGGVIEEATVSDVASPIAVLSGFHVVDLPEASTSLLPEGMPTNKRKNQDQPETSPQPLKKAKVAGGALKRATSMTCRIPVPRKPFASDKGKGVAPPPDDGEPVAPEMKGSRTAAFIRRPFRRTPTLPQWK